MVADMIICKVRKSFNVASLFGLLFKCDEIHQNPKCVQAFVCMPQ